MENVKPKPTIEDVEAAWKKWEAYKERIEQYQIIDTFFKDVRLEAMYTSLQTDWNEDHAAIFLRCIDVAMGKAEAKDD